MGPSYFIGRQPQSFYPLQIQYLRVAGSIRQRHITPPRPALGVRHEKLTAKSRALIGMGAITGDFVKTHILTSLARGPQVHLIVGIGKGARIIHPVSGIHVCDNIVWNIGCPAAVVSQTHPVTPGSIKSASFGCLDCPNPVHRAILIPGNIIWASRRGVIMKINLRRAHNRGITWRIVITHATTVDLWPQGFLRILAAPWS